MSHSYFCNTSKICYQSHMPGRWGIRFCPYRGFFLFSVSLHENSGLTCHWKASQELIPGGRHYCSCSQSVNLWGLSATEDSHMIIPLPLATGSATRPHLEAPKSLLLISASSEIKPPRFPTSKHRCQLLPSSKP